MFNNIPKEIEERMEVLREIERKDKENGKEKQNRLRQIPPETGKFISLLFATSPVGTAVEIGTSAGYSSLWLAIAAREMKRKLFTFELSEDKINIAKETFNCTETTDVIKLVEGDALVNLKEYNDISFCFLDSDKELYESAYDLVIPKMVKGGILIADNVTSHYDVFKAFIEKVLKDDRVDALVVPIGNGELVCRIR